MLVTSWHDYLQFQVLRARIATAKADADADMAQLSGWHPKLGVQLRCGHSNGSGTGLGETPKWVGSFDAVGEASLVDRAGTTIAGSTASLRR